MNETPDRVPPENTSETGPTPQGPSTPAPDIEPPMQDAGDVDIRSIGRFLVGLVVGLVLVAGVVYLQVVWLSSKTNASRAPATFRAAERLPPPPPNLQTSPRDEMRRLRTAQEAELEKTEWVDRERKIVRIPIDRATARLVRDGLPAWPPAPTATPSTTPSSTATPSPTPSATPARTPTPERQP